MDRFWNTAKERKTPAPLLKDPTSFSLFFSPTKYISLKKDAMCYETTSKIQICGKSIMYAHCE